MDFPIKCIHYSAWTSCIVSQTAKDGLRRELEFYLLSQPDCNHLHEDKAQNGLSQPTIHKIDGKIPRQRAEQQQFLASIWNECPR